MDCKNAQTLIAGYLDRELDPVQTVETEDHLHACAALLPELQQTIKSLTRALEQALSISRPQPVLRSAFSGSCAKRPKPSRSLDGCPGRGLGWRLPWQPRRLFYFTLVPFLRGPSTEEILTRGSGLRPCSLADGEPFSRRSLFRPAHGEAVVQR